MKVYVLEVGSHEDAYVKGVYTSAEAAMATWHPAPRPPADRSGDRTGRTVTYEWKQARSGDWEFGADWEDAAIIREYEVQGVVLAQPESALRAAARELYQADIAARKSLSSNAETFQPERSPNAIRALLQLGAALEGAPSEPTDEEVERATKTLQAYLWGRVPVAGEPPWYAEPSWDEVVRAVLRAAKGLEVVGTLEGTPESAPASAEISSE